MNNFSQTFLDGTRHVGFNNGDGTFTTTSYDATGAVVSTETVTGLPIEPMYLPLDPTGALATLLVVDGVLTLTDAALAIRQSEQALIAEAEAWSLGG